MKLLIYLLLLLTMPLAAQGKTDEKTLLDRIVPCCITPPRPSTTTSLECGQRRLIEIHSNQISISFATSLIVNN